LTTFEALYVPAPLREAVSDQSWLAAMLQAEQALAKLTGAEADDDVFRPESYDIAALCEEVSNLSHSFGNRWAVRNASFADSSVGSASASSRPLQ